MVSHGSVAKAVRLWKEKCPQDYCRVPRCLYRLHAERGQWVVCPRHAQVFLAKLEAEVANA